MSRLLNAQAAKNRALMFYCTPIPYSFTKPAFDAAIEVAPAPPSPSGVPSPFYVDFSSPNVMSLLLQSITPLPTYKCYNPPSVLCNTNESFWFAIDKNGVVRMSGMPPDSPTFKVMGGTVLPYLFGVETAGFRSGDRMYIYYSDLNTGKLYWADSEEGDGGYTFDVSKTDVITVQGGELKEAFGEQRCIPELNTSIWGWLDTMEADLASIPELEGQVSGYEEQVTGYKEQVTGYESGVKTHVEEINDFIFKMANAVDKDPADYGWQEDPHEEGIE